MKKGKRIFIRAAAIILAILCLLPLCSCFDPNYNWDLPEGEDADFDWAALFGAMHPGRNYGVGKNGLRLALSDDGSHYIIESGKNCTARILNLPSSYNGIPITEIADSAFAGLDKLKSISIPDCITKVGANAFEGCENLEYQTSEGGKYLGNTQNPYAVLIGGVESNVQNLTIHNQTRVIADSAFQENKELTELNIPKSVEYIGTNAFYACTTLSSLVFEGGACRIGDFAFSVTGLTKIDMGNYVTEIGRSAFSSCKSLVSIVIPDSVKSMGDYAFSMCTRLTAVKIGKGITLIDEYSFVDCERLKSVELSDSVKEIGKFAFCGCSVLSDEFLPESIEVIGENAFTSTNLPFRGFNSWAYYIGTEENPYAFLIYVMPKDISQPANILLHKDTKVIARGAFMNNLHNDSVVAIDGGEGTYLRSQDNCIIEIDSGTLVAGAGKCTIPDDGSVKAIGDYAFYENKYLDSLFYLPASVSSVGEYAFYGCRTLVSVNLAPGVETVGDYAFAVCTLLSEVGFSNKNLKSIGEGAFYGCTGLGIIILPESLTYLGDYAFYDCKKLHSVQFWSKISEIGNGTFENCAQLQSVTHFGGIRSIGESAFRGCKRLTDFEFAEGLKYIGDSAFISCEKLPAAKLPDSLLEIGDFAFGYCYELDSVSLGKEIVRIGENAFTSLGCDIEYRGNIDEWEDIDLGDYYSNEGIKVICLDGESEIPTVTTEPYN